MIEQPAPATASGVSSVAGLLEAARERRRVADAAEADLLVLACGWAEAHPPESITHAAGFPIPGSEGEEPIAGVGCPLVAEFCIAEFGAVLGMSTASAKHLIGQALELKYRLPRLYRRVLSGEVPAWRARRVAEATIHAHPALSPEAAGWVDAQVAPFAARCGTGQVDRLVAEAIRRHGPAVLAEDPDDPCPPCPDTRHVVVERDQVAYAGTVRVEAELDLADAHDLDTVLAHGARTLKALGSTEGLDARRAIALGELARRQLALDLAAGAGRSAGDTVADGPDATLPAARQIELHLHFPAHLTDDATDGEFRSEGLGRLEEGQRLVLLEQVKAWCAGSHTRVVVRPVVDLAAHQAVPGYAIPDRLREQVELRDATCVFPWCGRSARGCQIDHVVAYDHDHPDQGGQTASDNLAPLCTRHHRLKTHGRWQYQMTALGEYEWTSPYGHRYRRDPTGTTPLNPPESDPTQRRRR